MTKKGTTGQKLPKGESLYNPKLVARVKEVILELEPIKSNGDLHYGRIAKIMDIASRTFSHWRDTESKYYKPKFAKAIIAAHEELTETIELSKTKRAMIARSQPYNRVKKTKELKTLGPKLPAMGSLDKKALLQIARVLGLKKVDKKMTNGVLKLRIVEEVERQTKEVLVVVKQEEERMHGCAVAGKMVTSNIGPKDKRWVEKAEVEVVGKSLADIAAIMSGKKAG